MKHLKSYNDYSINEELTRHQRAWLNLPVFLFAFIGKLMGIYPLLNLRWKEIKKKTNDSEFDPLFATSGSTPNEMKDDLTEISLGDLKASKVKIPMILRGWKIYSSNRETHDKRKIVYLTKDTIKKGDKYTGERLSDRDVYPDSAFTYKTNQYIDKGKKRDLKIKDGYPCVILIAKFDKQEESEELEQYIDDICLDMEDEFNVEVEPNFNPQQDKLYLSIKPTKENDPNRRNLIFTEDLANKIESMTNRILEFLKIEGKKGFKSEIAYMPKDLYYLGTAGRFPEIIEAAKTYDRRNDSEYYDTYRKSLKLSFCGNNFRYQKTDINTHLNTEDMRILLKDIDNCSFSVNKPKQPLTEIPLYWISVEIKKV